MRKEARANQLLPGGAGSEQRVAVPRAAAPPRRSLFQEFLNSYTMSAGVGHPVEIGVTFACRVLLASVCFLITVEAGLRAYRGRGFLVCILCAVKPLACFLWRLRLLHLLKTASDVNAGRKSHDIQKIPIFFFLNPVINPIKADR